MARSASGEKYLQWQERLRRQAKSGLTVAEFCGKERISAPSFYAWRRKLAEASVGAVAQRSEASPASFVPVHIAPVGVLQVIFPNGVELTVPASDSELVRMSIDALALARTRPGGA